MSVWREKRQTLFWETVNDRGDQISRLSIDCLLNLTNSRQ